MLVGTKLGRYEVLKCLAHGATTDLLLARTRGMAGFERHVVIKRIHNDQAHDPAFVQAFMTEARLAAILHHNNIVQVQDIGEDGGAPYFAMEYVHGEDVRSILAQLIKKRERMPLEHVITIVTAVASALHHAHERQTPDGKPLSIVHRDVTPSNILVGYDGNVKVVDFGIAKATITITTQVGQLKGRTPYMAPEQCGGKPVDRRSDVFALGIVLWEMSTMRRLFKGVTDHDTMQKIVLGEVPKPSTMRPDIPLTLESIIMKALAKVPAERYQSAAELAAALETFAGAASLATSTSALASYLAQHLGPRPEPWLVEGSAPIRAAAVDFDSEEATAVSADKDPEPEPSTAKVKPVSKLVASAAPVVMEKRVTSGAIGKAESANAQPAKPEPAKAEPAKAEARPAKAPDDKAKGAAKAAEEPTASASIVISEEVGAPAGEERAATNVEPRASTHVGNPPPPPKTLDKHDMTELVKPLPLDLGDETPASGTFAAAIRRKRFIAGAVGIAVIALGVLAFKIVTSGSKSDAATRTASAPAMPPPSASDVTKLVQPELAAKPAEPAAAAPSEPSPAAKPDERVAKPATGTVEAYAAKPADDPPPANTYEVIDPSAKTADTAAKPADDTAKPVEPATKPVETTTMPAETAKPAHHAVAATTPKPAPHAPVKKPATPVKKPATPPKKPATPPAPSKPKYDPDSLFLKGPK